MIFTVRIILTMLIKTNVFFIQIAFTRVMKTKNDVNSAGHFQLKERQPRSHGNEVGLAEFFWQTWRNGGKFYMFSKEEKAELFLKKQQERKKYATRRKTNVSAGVSLKSIYQTKQTYENGIDMSRRQPVRQKRRYQQLHRSLLFHERLILFFIHVGKQVQKAKRRNRKRVEMM